MIGCISTTTKSHTDDRRQPPPGKGDNMKAKEIRELTGLSRAAFCRLYGIPLRTMENYEAGTREAPAWVLALLERVVKADTENEGGKD